MVREGDVNLAILRVVVASTNPVKVQAVANGFGRMFPDKDSHVSTVTVPSGVRHQPLSDQEALEGALTRAQNAAASKPDADYWIGIEGGVEEVGADMVASAWVVVLSASRSATLCNPAAKRSGPGLSTPTSLHLVQNDGLRRRITSSLRDSIWSARLVGKGRTGAFFLPPAVADLIRQGKELGEADDIVFGRFNSKQENGAVGILTGDVIDRRRLYEEAVILALIPFKNEALYLARESYPSNP